MVLRILTVSAVLFPHLLLRHAVAADFCSVSGAAEQNHCAASMMSTIDASVHRRCSYQRNAPKFYSRIFSPGGNHCHHYNLRRTAGGCRHLEFRRKIQYYSSASSFSVAFPSLVWMQCFAVIVIVAVTKSTTETTR